MTQKLRKLATTTEVACILGIHPFRISKLFGAAQCGRRFNGVVYDLHQIAELISEFAGFQVAAADLPKLISRKSAIALLNDLGEGRTARTWSTWAEDGDGPRPIKIGGRIFYLRSDVLDWGYQLKQCRRGYVPAGQSRWMR